MLLLKRHGGEALRHTDMVSQLGTYPMTRAYCVNVRLSIPYLIVVTNSKEVTSGLSSVGIDRLNGMQFTVYLMGFFLSSLNAQL